MGHYNDGKLNVEVMARHGVGWLHFPEGLDYDNSPREGELVSAHDFKLALGMLHSSKQYKLAGECEYEPAEPDECIYCWLYLSAQKREQWEKENFWIEVDPGEGLPVHGKFEGSDITVTVRKFEDDEVEIDMSCNCHSCFSTGEAGLDYYAESFVEMGPGVYHLKIHWDAGPAEDDYSDWFELNLADDGTQWR